MTSKKILDIINDESKIFSIQELGKITLELRKDVCREQKKIAEKTDVKSKAKKIWLSGEENAFKIYCWKRYSEAEHLFPLRWSHYICLFR